MALPTVTTPSPKPPIKKLILDSGPLLSLTPLRHLSTHLLLPPSILPELRDPRARAHYQSLVALPDITVSVRQPDALSMMQVIRWAKHTGDYAVLSKVDLEVLALTMMVEVEENGYMRVRDEPGKPAKGTKPARLLSSTSPAPQDPTTSSLATSSTSSSEAQHPIQPIAGPSKPSPWSSLPKPAAHPASEEDGLNDEEYPSLGQAGEQMLDAEEEDVTGDGEKVARGDRQDFEETDEDEEGRRAAKESRSQPGPHDSSSSAIAPPSTAEAQPEEKTPPTLLTPIYDDEDQALLPSDGEGDWITPSNVAAHKSLDLGLVPASNSSAAPIPSPSSSSKPAKVKGPKHIPQMKAACMSGDYAVQNVLLQMGLNLVGEEGKRIDRVKSWVLRCHGCFKICKDSSKKFCPSCGNATLIRASVTTTAASSSSGKSTEELVQVHLKPNFQYKTRGTIYSIPSPKMGSAKGQSGGGSGLILREDQKEFQTAVKRVEGRQAKDERRLQKAAEAQAEGKGSGSGVGGWNDPDWEAEMLVVGLSGKGRRDVGGEMPRVGWGRGNPNQVRKGRK